jgi:hypothetical protein
VTPITKFARPSGKFATTCEIRSAERHNDFGIIVALQPNGGRDPIRMHIDEENKHFPANHRRRVPASQRLRFAVPLTACRRIGKFANAPTR